MKKIGVIAALLVFALAGWSQQTSREAGFDRTVDNPWPPPPETQPLYSGTIPNSIPGPDQEKDLPGSVQAVSRPTLTIYLPAKAKAIGTSIIIFPGGGYMGEAWTFEGTSIAEAFQDHGVAAFLVKYRLPSDATMPNKSIGPLQDAQQAIAVVREHAGQWHIDPAKVGVIGFSAGGHLASTVGTHFDKSYIPNPGNLSLRPDFMILMYPVISMTDALAHMGSRKALLGEAPSEDQIRLFSNEQQVTSETPPTLLIHATDDQLVDVDNSVAFYEALHRHNVSAEMILFAKGNHGLLSIPRDQWMEPVFAWMDRNGWLRR